MFHNKALKKIALLNYAAAQREGMPYNTPYHYSSMDCSQRFIIRVVMGLQWLLEHHKISERYMNNHLRTHGIRVARTTVDRVKRGEYRHLNSLILGFFAMYFELDIIDLYNIGESVIRGEKELRNFTWNGTCLTARIKVKLTKEQSLARAKEKRDAKKLNK